MFLISDKWIKLNDLQKIVTLCESGINGSYLVRVKDTAHYNFGDSYHLLKSIFGVLLIPRMLLKEANSDMGLFGNSGMKQVNVANKKMELKFTSILGNSW